MYRLEDSGTKFIDPRTEQFVLCDRNMADIAKSYGCTAQPGLTDTINYDYPFNSSTITIGVESDVHQVPTVNQPGGIPFNRNVQLGYLHNVVTQELGVQIKGSDTLPDDGYVPHSAIEAQAIASRTFIYHRDHYRDQYGGVIDNSNAYQVFIPYTYDLLDANSREDVDLGIAQRFYMTESVSSYPLDAQYGADNDGDTTTGNPTLIGSINYLSSVQDPISAHQGTDFGTDRGGMASRGARRWSYGHQSWTPTEGGDFWSVQWNDAFKILTHYYTGIQIRDADAPSAETPEIPDYRWVPLEIQASALACVGKYTSLTVRLQNSGTEKWPNQSVIVNITHTGTDPVVAAAAGAIDSTIDGEILPGDDVEIELTIQPLTAGINHYYIDLYSNDAGGLFSHQLPAWPRYELWEIPAIECPTAAEGTFLPIIIQDIAVQ
ncbi:MAG: hypothetical protein KDD92_17065 [Caldilineaceae bacterium]|nr:hypothetical protein [Caldilineaceae bacterium]